MAQQTPAQRIRTKYLSADFRYLIVFGLTYLGFVFVFIPALLYGKFDVQGLFDNIGAGMVGAAVTFYIFDKFTERRDRERDMLRALRQMKSLVNDTALTALEELREEELLIDGSLSGADLSLANLSTARLYRTELHGVDFSSANLEGATLSFANLSGAEFTHANLSGATLEAANLKNATLVAARLSGADLSAANLESANLPVTNLSGATFASANLRGAVLQYTNLQTANLMSANLQGADLEGANLFGANLAGVNLLNTDLSRASLKGVTFELVVHGRVLKAVLDKTTTLPDGSKYDPEKGLEQLGRFTDPKHLDYWQPEWAAFGSYPAWLLHLASKQ